MEVTSGRVELTMAYAAFALTSTDKALFGHGQYCASLPGGPGGPAGPG